MFFMPLPVPSPATTRLVDLEARCHSASTQAGEEERRLAGLRAEAAATREALAAEVAGTRSALAAETSKARDELHEETTAARDALAASQEAFLVRGFGWHRQGQCQEPTIGWG